MKAVIIFQKISSNPKEDELDVLDQVRMVSEALNILKYDTSEVQMSLDIEKAIEQIRNIGPDLIFNLVESVDGSNELLTLAPMILRHIGIPFTGNCAEAMFITTNKILTKKILFASGIPFPEWFSLLDFCRTDKPKKYILKPVSEDGSLQLDEDSVFSGDDPSFPARFGIDNPAGYFVEEFIDGREFNLSILAGDNEPEVFPPAEILFTDYPENKPKVVGYRAKWIENSFEYINTPRTFEFPDCDIPVLSTLKDIALRCWYEFGLKGYARVDFRVDKNNSPYVLEINANPCIAKYSGFVSAAKQKGLEFHQIIKRIINDANK
jgi:D-alanine-D-alanine ligase